MMIRKVMTLIISICVFQVQAVSKTETAVTKLSQALTSAHTHAFSKESLLTEPLTKDELTSWNEAILGVSQFVSDAGIADLIKVFNRLSRISDSLIRALKDNEEYFKKHNFAGMYDNFLKNDSNIKRISLLESTKTAAQVQTQLNADMSKKDAKMLLSQLALQLELTISKMFNDFGKLIMPKKDK